MIVGEKVIGNGEVIIWTRGGKIRMSYQNFVKAMDLAPKCKFYTTVGGKSKEEIEKFQISVENFMKNMVIYRFMVTKFLELNLMMIQGY